MEERIGKNKDIDFIRIIQNPSHNVIDSCKLIMKRFDVDCSDENEWIEFENKFSVQNFSGLNGNFLRELVFILSVMNTQGGVASNYMNEIKCVPRYQILRMYYKYIALRNISYYGDTFYIVSMWLYENFYISELELNRLLCYSLKNDQVVSVLSDFNRVLIQEDIANYVEEYWS